ncbi:ubiquinol-cytochrome c reductase iron-sulfur subunit [Bermanella sp. WJH001]|uniref:ubiquinol-cytochrome c reductase iron-sulfur subunit n=1 Tax=Bermanella sp. WJH001 TaxID=3048005 RepID=UPI0024BE03F5|nr:ubiquinol-cytochrome c reductase iron-sulfur subunit [Bermanella sp. WJH001]MDJ1537922.1 ubiquinol-cytochrome c reductase iron-sulfur subunit [Bermanella sp. WJH001]
MSNDGVNTGRRRFLIATTAVGGGIGAVGVAVPFVKSWNPSEKAKAAGAPAKADVGKIEPGAMIVVEWRGKPVYLYRRTDESVGLLETISDELKDPDNADEGQQPAYAKNVQRSRKPEIAVIEGVCTHLGCAPKYIPEVVPQPFQDNWVGGFFCPCHGSRFDLAGRVYKGSPAGKNLKVPPYSYVDENTILIGVDEENS